MRRQAWGWARVWCPSSIHGGVRHEPKVNKCKANLPVHAGGREDTPTTGNKAALFTKNPVSPLFPSKNILEAMKKRPAQSKSLASHLLWRQGEKEKGRRNGGGEGVPGKA